MTVVAVQVCQEGDVTDKPYGNGAAKFIAVGENGSL